jgi:hypothetical protein
MLVSIFRIDPTNSSIILRTRTSHIHQRQGNQTGKEITQGKEELLTIEAYEVPLTQEEE